MCMPCLGSLATTEDHYVSVRYVFDSKQKSLDAEQQVKSLKVKENATTIRIYYNHDAALTRITRVSHTPTERPTGLRQHRRHDSLLSSHGGSADIEPLICFCMYMPNPGSRAATKNQHRMSSVFLFFFFHVTSHLLYLHYFLQRLLFRITGTQDPPIFHLVAGGEVSSINSYPGSHSRYAYPPPASVRAFTLFCILSLGIQKQGSSTTSSVKLGNEAVQVVVLTPLYSH